MDREGERGPRVHIVGEEAIPGLSPEDAIKKADEILAKRVRGRVIGGEVVPPEEEMRALEVKAKDGKISFSEQERLDELRFKLKGSKVDRWVKGEK